MIRRRTTRRGSRGQALVEVALVSLVFLTMVLGLVEVGRAVWSYNWLAHATREGARYAIVHGSKASDPSGPGSTHYTAPDQDAMIAGVVQRHLEALDDDQLSIQAEWPDGTNQRGGRVKVTARYRFESIFSSLLPLPTVDLVGSSTMTISY